MYKPLNKILILLLATAVGATLTACDDGDPGSYSNAPELDFECSFADAIGCDATNDGKTVFIGLHEDTSLDCSAHLALLNRTQMIASFDYSSVTTANNVGGILTGVAVHWVNTQAMPIILLPLQTFRVCAFIDANSNEMIDVNEPIQESNVTIGSGFLPLSNWSNY
jgi:hypothetical protein